MSMNGEGHEVRHDLQWRDGCALAEEFTGAVCRGRQRRFPGGASNDLMPNLQQPGNPVPALDPSQPPQVKGMGD
jgi:hypothetical protein